MAVKISPTVLPRFKRAAFAASSLFALILIIAAVSSPPRDETPQKKAPSHAPSAGVSDKPPPAPESLSFAPTGPRFRESLSSFEQSMVATPSPARAREDLNFFTARPHRAGSDVDKETADFVKKTWLDAGVPDVQLEDFKVLLSTPLSASLNIEGQGPMNLSEPSVTTPPRPPLPARAAAFANAEPEAGAELPFHGYSPSGNVTNAPVVYVGYGTPDEFKNAAHSEGLSQAARGENKLFPLGGALCLARYGRLFRGLKVLLAQRYYCSGVLIYSDPEDDGPTPEIDFNLTLAASAAAQPNDPRGDGGNGRAYPFGPWRPSDSIQRGSVHFLSKGPGDPSTPGFPSGEDEDKRLPFNADGTSASDSMTVPSIPSLPLSAANGAALRACVNAGGCRATLKSENKWFLRTIWNVIGRLPGSGSEASRTVYLGNHRDAWVVGGVDPGTGSASLNQAARALGGAYSAGWRPRRSIVLASWDAEEYGLVGSTEHVEKHAADLTTNCVAYLNVDESVEGSHTFQLKSTPSLVDIVVHLAGFIPDPTGVDSNLRKSWERLSGGTAEYGFLGSGSDFTAFFQHEGIPATDMRFAGGYGVYHSTMDNFDFVDRFADPGFARHTAVSRLWTLVAVSLANEAVLPLTFSRYATAMADGLRLIVPKPLLLGAPPCVVNVSCGVTTATFSDLDPTMSKLEAAVGRFKEVAAAFDRAASAARSGEQGGHSVESLNARAMAVDRNLLSAKGIRQRAWFKHLVFAPGLYKGYAADVFPGVVQAVDCEGFVEAREAILSAAEVVNRAADGLAL